MIDRTLNATDRCDRCGAQAVYVATRPGYSELLFCNHHFDELNETIPYARYGKVKSLEMRPYPHITLAMPGRHAEQTTPRGGDFVVMVTDKALGWNRHQFKHDDIFHDVSHRRLSSAIQVDDFMRFYLDVIQGESPDNNTFGTSGLDNVLDSLTFFRAVQCLAVAEHRRYHQHEARYGGRYLPFRFAAGIAEGLWTAEDAIKEQKYGRPAVERLEKSRGLPLLTADLLGA
jgi:hypothetical protein